MRKIHVALSETTQDAIDRVNYLYERMDSPHPPIPSEFVDAFALAVVRAKFDIYQAARHYEPRRAHFKFSPELRGPDK